MRDIELRSEPLAGERMDTIGVDWGPKGLRLVHRSGEFGIYKIPGHSAWTSQFSPWKYHPTSYGLVHIREGGSRFDGRWGVIDMLPKSEMTPGWKWRAALDDLFKEVRALVAGEVGILDMYGLLEGQS